MAASSFGIRCEYQVPDEAFMALELTEGGLKGCYGTARYEPEFAAARDATQVTLLLFDRPGELEPTRVVELDRRRNRPEPYWHVFVPGLLHGQVYAWRVDGPWAPERGLRFDRRHDLLDPYGRGVVAVPAWSPEAKAGSTRPALRSLVVDTSRYDWEGDTPLRLPVSRTVIYEMHVRGFTRHPSSGVAPERRGTYAGVVDKIPYLQELGVSAVELMPVFCPTIRLTDQPTSFY